MTWFTGKTALVTGAARGIGRGVAELLVELDARVVAVDIDDRALEEAFAGHSSVIPWPGDLSSRDTASLADSIMAAEGPVELLVNNVGIDTPHTFRELSERDFDLVLSTNLRGPWFFTKRLGLRLLEEGRSGSIVFISSLHDSFIRGLPHYSASKAAVAMLVRELAQDLGPAGIRVNSISPGIVRTAHVPDAPVSGRGPAIPLGRIGEPLDVARMTAVLLSDEWSGYVTGANVRVDGGLGVHSFSFDS
jgi:NAD(P)-dependent dehydrogenase (short-subunit alcohol dehydrogenase family)